MAVGVAAGGVGGGLTVADAELSMGVEGGGAGVPVGVGGGAVGTPVDPATSVGSVGVVVAATGGLASSRLMALLTV